VRREGREEVDETAAADGVVMEAAGCVPSVCDNDTSCDVLPAVSAQGSSIVSGLRGARRA